MAPSKFKYRVEYIALRLLETIVGIVPRSIALRIGSVIGALLYKTGIYRHVAESNIRYVNLWPAQSADQIIRELYQTIGRYTVDFLRTDQKKLPHQIRGGELFDRAVESGKGVIVILAHFGNWELLATLFGEKYHASVIAKPMRNPLTENWILKKRKRTNVNVVYPKQALRKLYTVIKEGDVAALLIDQHAGKHGTLVPFLGKDASTVRTVAGIAQKSGCTVLSAYARMGDDGVYTISFEHTGNPISAQMSEEEAINALQKHHNDIISGWIQEYPAHWFGWFHHRYRGTVDYRRKR